jgi:hypothetical protein
VGVQEVQDSSVRGSEFSSSGISNGGGRNNLFLALGAGAMGEACTRKGGPGEGGGSVLLVCAMGNVNVQADEEGPGRGGGINVRGRSNDACEVGDRRAGSAGVQSCSLYDSCT